KAASSRISSGSIASLPSAIRPGLPCVRADHLRQALDGQAVSLDAEPADHGLGAARHIGAMAEALTRVNVADMNLDGRERHAEDGVEQGDRGVRIAAWIDDDAGSLGASRLVNRLDDLALMIGLAELDAQPMSGGAFPAQRLDVGEGGMAV